MASQTAQEALQASVQRVALIVKVRARRMQHGPTSSQSCQMFAPVSFCLLASLQTP